jgi:hypothetical protein
VTKTKYFFNYKNTVGLKCKSANKFSGCPPKRKFWQNSWFTVCIFSGIIISKCPARVIM